MITYGKSKRPRASHADSPQFPFWHRTWIEPYSDWAANGIRIDLETLDAREAGRIEIQVSQELGDLTSEIGVPLVIDACGFAESMVRRGSEILNSLEATSGKTILISANGMLPEGSSNSVTAILAWPPDPDALNQITDKAASRDHWGIAIPIIHPVTTDLEFIDLVRSVAKRNGAEFLAAIPIESEPSARRALVRLRGKTGSDEYEMLFHGDLEMITVATERHIAALANELGIRDSIPLPDPSSDTNWAAAAHLAKAGTRMLRMKWNVELGWSLVRAASTIASLEKNLKTIAASASLSIIESLHELAALALEEWIAEGHAELFDDVDERWRLRRDLVR